ESCGCGCLHPSVTHSQRRQVITPLFLAAAALSLHCFIGPLLVNGRSESLLLCVHGRSLSQVDLQEHRRRLVDTKKQSYELNTGVDSRLAVSLLWKSDSKMEARISLTRSGSTFTGDW